MNRVRDLLSEIELAGNRLRSARHHLTALLIAHKEQVFRTASCFCGEELPKRLSPGRPRLFCSPACGRISRNALRGPQ